MTPFIRRLLHNNPPDSVYDGYNPQHDVRPLPGETWPATALALAVGAIVGAVFAAGFAAGAYFF